MAEVRGEEEAPVPEKAIGPEPSAAEDDEDEVDADREVAPKRQRREHVGYDGSAPPGAMEAAEAAAGALAEAAAGSVLDPIGDEAVVARLRGLPWSFGPEEVCEFLETVGTKVQPEAVTMLHNAAGEAFIVLEAEAQMKEVMLANKRQVGKRYVEVFSSTPAEKHAACERNRATMKEDAGYRGVLRMRGLPYTATVDDVVQFFNYPAELSPTNVHLLRRADGRASGDAYVIFDTEEAATQAFGLDKQKLGSRWVDLFQSSKGEFYALTSTGGVMTTTATAANGGSGALGEGYSVVKLRGLPWNATEDAINKFLSPVAVPTGGIHMISGNTGRPSGIAYVELSSEEDQAAVLKKDKQNIGGRYIDIFSCSQSELQGALSGGSGGDAQFVKLRGLPYSTTEHQIVAFFQPLQVIAVQIALNNNGQASGFGFVQFRTSDDANKALENSNQSLGNRYVEVFRCNRMDMEQAHAHAMQMAPMMRQQQMFQMGMAHHGGGGPMGQMGQMAAMQAGPRGMGPMGPMQAGRGDNAFSAYQGALQALAQRPAAPAYPPAGAYQNVHPSNCYAGPDAAYHNSAGMQAGNYGATEVAYSTAATPGSGFGQGGGGYSSTPAPYGQPSEAAYMSSVGAAATPASAPGTYGQGGASFPTDYYNHPQYTQQYGYYTQ